MKENDTTVMEPIECDLIGVDGNAFSLMGHFRQCAKRQGRNKEEIDKVLKEAMGGDYDNLVGTLFRYCK